MTIAIVLLSLLHLRFGEWQDISASESGRTSPGSLLSGEWQDISASGSGLVKAKLELLEKKFDRLLDPIDKLNSKSGPSCDTKIPCCTTAGHLYYSRECGR